MDVLVVDKDGALPRIVTEVLETIIIGDRAAATSSERQLCYKVRCMPDLDLLDNETIIGLSRKSGSALWCSGATREWCLPSNCHGTAASDGDSDSFNVQEA